MHGDLVLLEAGDRIRADLTLVRVDGLAVDKPTLTGESVPVHPEPDGTVLAGAFVAQGDARAVLTVTGSSTRLAVPGQDVGDGSGAVTRSRDG